MLTLSQANEELNEARGALETMTSEGVIASLAAPTRAVLRELADRTGEVFAALEEGDVEAVNEQVLQAAQAARSAKAALDADREASSENKDSLQRVHQILLDLEGQLAV